MPSAYQLSLRLPGLSATRRILACASIPVRSFVLRYVASRSLFRDDDSPSSIGGDVRRNRRHHSSYWRLRVARRLTQESPESYLAHL
jgi:hypothetical protein